VGRGAWLRPGPTCLKRSQVTPPELKVYLNPHLGEALSRAVDEHLSVPPIEVRTTFRRETLVMRIRHLTPDVRARIVSALMLLSMIAAVLAGAADCKWT
jgi:hypothetical protein